MAHPTHTPEIDIQKSELYQELIQERHEILTHKWLESEKAGHDIGYERALIDWIINHRDAWRKYWRASRKNSS